MLRLILIGFLIYFAAKVASALLKPKKSPIEVHGKGKNQPLDLSEEDIQDVQIKEEKKNK